MAYNVSAKFKEKIYSGGAINRATLTIDGVQIPNSNIKKITISSPIIDTTNESFYIGTFIANKLEIEFKNANNIDLNGEVFLKIGTKVEEPDPVQGTDGYEDVPMGYFLIATSPEDYYNNAKIVCYDKSILFKKTVDISQWFDETTKDISAEELLQALCTNFEVTLGGYPTSHPNKDFRIGIYDNTYTGKQYIGWIAEIMGCNAKIGRDGQLYLLPLVRSTTATINALKSKSWVLGEKYKISNVYYENGSIVSDYGTPTDNRLTIRLDNPFMLTNNYDAIVSNLYTELNGFEMYSVKNENYGDPSMDCWDLIQMNLGNDNYVVLNDNTLVYEMNIATTINPQIPTKQVQSITSNITSEERKAHNMKVVIDQINGSITDIFEDIDEVNDTISDNDDWYRGQITNIQRDINGLTTTVTKIGGRNLLMNTAPYRVLGINSLENWVGSIYYQTESKSVSGYALVLMNGEVYQTIDTIPNGIYSLAFNYKKLSDLANATVSYNGRNIELDESEGTVSTTGEINSGSFTITFNCDVNNGYEIYDLRLVLGDTATSWSQNQNELKTKSVNIGDGITIDSNISNLKNNIDINGMKVTNKLTNDEVLVVTDENVVVNKFKSNDVSNIDGLLVQKIGSQIFITSITE